MEFKDLEVGIVIVPDSGFDCMAEGEEKVVLKTASGNYYVLCGDGRHFLSKEAGALAGFKKVD